MEEIVFWKEVDVKDVPDDPLSDYAHDQVTNRWLKRVVINILSDREIEKLDKNSFEGLMPRFIWKEGYKAMQERLIGGEGL